MEKTETEIKEQIRELFISMSSIEDLAHLLNIIYKEVIRNERLQLNKNKKRKEKFGVNAKILTYYGFKIKEDKGYTHFDIKKKTGGYRKISAPKFTLKIIQKCLAELFTIMYQEHSSAHGFVRSKNIVTNAAKHVGKRYVYNIDIKDFFPSTYFGRIRKVLNLPPFCLKGEKDRIAMLIANLCCCDKSLPQGAPSSPILTNIICRKLDARLSSLAIINKMYYTRYADDITFSSNFPVFTENMISEIKQIIKEEGYELNDKKERLQTWRQRQEVTGIIVNKKKNVRRSYIQDIRFLLHIWKKYGLEQAEVVFQQKYISQNGFAHKSFIRHSGRIISIRYYLDGKLNYLKMVRGTNDPIYTKLNSAYVDLIDRIDGISVKSLEAKLTTVIETWERSGDINEAKTLYKKLGLDYEQ